MIGLLTSKSFQLFISSSRHVIFYLISLRGRRYRYRLILLIILLFYKHPILQFPQSRHNTSHKNTANKYKTNNTNNSKYNK